MDLTVFAAIVDCFLIHQDVRDEAERRTNLEYKNLCGNIKRLIREAGAPPSYKIYDLIDGEYIENHDRKFDEASDLKSRIDFDNLCAVDLNCDFLDFMEVMQMMVKNEVLNHQKFLK